MLHEQRRELLSQLAAVDAAIAALGAADVAPPLVPPAEPDEPTTPAAGQASAVVPTRVASRRVLSDEHRHALLVGRRKAREAQDAANGLARETPNDSFVPAIGTREDSPVPRLVKRRTEEN